MCCTYEAYLKRFKVLRWRVFEGEPPEAWPGLREGWPNTGAAARHRWRRGRRGPEEPPIEDQALSG